MMEPQVTNTYQDSLVTHHSRVCWSYSISYYYSYSCFFIDIIMFEYLEYLVECKFIKVGHHTYTDFLLEWTSLDSSSGTLICPSLCPRHVGRNNYVP